jgi:hypothetical protein
MPKYDPFARYLRSRSELELTVAFTEIERIIDAALPPSARQQPVWWRNDLTPYRTSVQSRSWVGSGYAAEVINIDEQWVTFRKKSLASMQRDKKIPRRMQTISR